MPKKPHREGSPRPSNYPESPVPGKNEKSVKSFSELPQLTGIEPRSMDPEAKVLVDMMNEVKARLESDVQTAKSSNQDSHHIEIAEKNLQTLNECLSTYGENSKWLLDNAAKIKNFLTVAQKQSNLLEKSLSNIPPDTQGQESPISSQNGGINQVNQKAEALADSDPETLIQLIENNQFSQFRKLPDGKFKSFAQIQKNIENILLFLDSTAAEKQYIVNSVIIPLRNEVFSNLQRLNNLHEDAGDKRLRYRNNIINAYNKYLSILKDKVTQIKQNFEERKAWASFPERDETKTLEKEELDSTEWKGIPEAWHEAARRPNDRLADLRILAQKAQFRIQDDARYAELQRLANDWDTLTNRSQNLTWEQDVNVRNHLEKNFQTQIEAIGASFNLVANDIQQAIETQAQQFADWAGPDLVQLRDASPEIDIDVNQTPPTPQAVAPKRTGWWKGRTVMSPAAGATAPIPTPTPEVTPRADTNPALPDEATSSSLLVDELPIVSREEATPNITYQIDGGDFILPDEALLQSEWEKGYAYRVQFIQKLRHKVQSLTLLAEKYRSALDLTKTQAKSTNAETGLPGYASVLENVKKLDSALQVIERQDPLDVSFAEVNELRARILTHSQRMRVTFQARREKVEDTTPKPPTPDDSATLRAIEAQQREQMCRNFDSAHTQYLYHLKLLVEAEGRRRMFEPQMATRQIAMSEIADWMAVSEKSFLEQRDQLLRMGEVDRVREADIDVNMWRRRLRWEALLIEAQTEKSPATRQRASSVSRWLKVGAVAGLFTFLHPSTTQDDNTLLPPSNPHMQSGNVWNGLQSALTRGQAYVRANSSLSANTAIPLNNAPDGVAIPGQSRTESPVVSNIVSSPDSDVSDIPAPSSPPSMPDHDLGAIPNDMTISPATEYFPPNITHTPSVSPRVQFPQRMPIPRIDEQPIAIDTSVPLYRMADTMTARFGERADPNQRVVESLEQPRPQFRVEIQQNCNLSTVMLRLYQEGRLQDYYADQPFMSSQQAFMQRFYEVRLATLANEKFVEAMLEIPSGHIDVIQAGAVVNIAPYLQAMAGEIDVSQWGQLPGATQEGLPDSERVKRDTTNNDVERASSNDPIELAAQSESNKKAVSSIDNTYTRQISQSDRLGDIIVQDFSDLFSNLSGQERDELLWTVLSRIRSSQSAMRELGIKDSNDPNWVLNHRDLLHTDVLKREIETSRALLFPTRPLGQAQERGDSDSTVIEKSNERPIVSEEVRDAYVTSVQGLVGNQTTFAARLFGTSFVPNTYKEFVRRNMTVGAVMELATTPQKELVALLRRQWAQIPIAAVRSWDQVFRQAVASGLIAREMTVEEAVDRLAVRALTTSQSKS